MALQLGEAAWREDQYSGGPVAGWHAPDGETGNIQPLRGCVQGLPALRGEPPPAHCLHLHLPLLQCACVHRALLQWVPFGYVGLIVDITYVRYKALWEYKQGDYHLSVY